MDSKEVQGKIRGLIADVGIVRFLADTASVLDEEHAKEPDPIGWSIGAVAAIADRASHEIRKVRP